jgi:hypothetical protein
MVKNKTASATSVSRTPTPAPLSLAALESELARAKSVQQHLENRITDVKTNQERAAKLRSAIRDLATSFGLKDESDILTMLRQQAAPDKPRRRFKVTEELEAKIIGLVRDGKSGSQIKKVTGISLPTIQALKGRHGLINHRVLSPSLVHAAD